MPDPHHRDLMLKQELSQQVGGRVELTSAEQLLDSLLHQLKVKEMAISPFPPAKHFFKVRHVIQKSPVFKLLQKMPKGKKSQGFSGHSHLSFDKIILYPAGAALHIHSSALASADWLVLNATYRPNCYICFMREGSVRFIFSAYMPFPRWGCSFWSRLDTLRAGLSDVTAFDNR